MTVFSQILKILFQTLENPVIFLSFILKINPFLHAFYIKFSKNIFFFLQILSFLKNSPWNLKYFYILRLSPLGMNEEKWKKSKEIKFYWDLFSNSVLLNEVCNRGVAADKPRPLLQNSLVCAIIVSWKWEKNVQEKFGNYKLRKWRRLADMIDMLMRPEAKSKFSTYLGKYQIW